MVGGMVNGKCTECGDWYYTKEKDENGRWIPIYEDGRPKINQWGKQQYKQHVHECGGKRPPVAGQQLERLHNKVEDRIQEAKDFVEDKAHSNHVNIFKMSGDIAIIKLDIETIKMHCETILNKLGHFAPASALAKEQEEVQAAVEEIAETDDKTELDSHSINFVAEGQAQQLPRELAD